MSTVLRVAAVQYVSIKSESEAFLQQKKNGFPRESLGVIYFSLRCRPKGTSISLSFLVVAVLGPQGGVIPLGAAVPYNMFQVLGVLYAVNVSLPLGSSIRMHPHKLPTSPSTSSLNFQES